MLITDTEQRTIFILGICTILYYLQESKPDTYRIIVEIFKNEDKPVIDYLDRYFTERPSLFFELYSRYSTAKSEVELRQRTENLKENSKRYNHIQH